MTLPAQPSPRVAALLEKVRATRGRLIFGLDATASRENMWDLACSLQSKMFEEMAKIGGLEVQLVWYRGNGECLHTSWTSDAYELAARMRKIRCEAGQTNIKRVLAHIRSEHQREKVNAAIFVGDACEESPQELYAAAAGLGVPTFLFQEGDGLALYVDQRGHFIVDHPPQKVEDIFRELARLTNGAWARFDAGAAAKLGELLQAVAAFVAGGIKALADLRTDSARKLLGQIGHGQEQNMTTTTAVAIDPKPKNKCFKKGQLVASFKANGREVTRTLIRIDELMPQLTCAEVKKLLYWMTFEELADPDTDPERRRELLSRMDKCPCCDRWLGHNNPPADAGEPEPPYRRQGFFKFDR
jgi:hypothetical protein